MPKTLTPDLPIGDIHHQWLVEEYEQHERGSWWYIIMISLGLVLVVYAMVTLNFLFALTIVLSAIIIFLQSHQTALQIPFAITELGVVVGSKFYQYNELGEFYIIYKPPEVKTIFIETKSIIRPTIRVHLHDQNPLEIRDTLRQYLPENVEKEEEPLAALAARRFKIH